VLPAVEESKNAVQGIKKAHLVEFRSMECPPNAVKYALESICLLLGERAHSWEDIRAILTNDDFIPRIVQFNTDYITPEIVDQIKQYVNNPDWDFEKVGKIPFIHYYLSVINSPLSQVNRASVACGPLVKWAKAQLSYAKMLNKVEPLNNELVRLERASKEKSDKEGRAQKADCRTRAEDSKA
jgi:dynein heavy chain 1